ncbi:MAG: hypothetical protein ACLQMT_12690 [Candidatus Acidiferrales bacterium]
MGALVEKEDAMIAIPEIAQDFDYPIAIREKDLRNVPSFRLEAHELCTICGERFGIGYLRTPRNEMEMALEATELPRKLTEMLARDHRQDREHRNLIELG